MWCFWVASMICGYMRWQIQVWSHKTTSRPFTACWLYSVTAHVILPLIGKNGWGNLKVIVVALPVQQEMLSYLLSLVTWVLSVMGGQAQDVTWLATVPCHMVSINCGQNVTWLDTTLTPDISYQIYHKVDSLLYLCGVILCSSSFLLLKQLHQQHTSVTM